MSDQSTKTSVPAGSNKPSYHHGDLAAALLDAADELLAQQGLQGFTLRGCARQAGVSHAAPKHHFGDAKGLLTRVATRGFERLTAVLQANQAQGEPSAAGQLRAVARGYRDFADTYPEHFRMMFRADLLQADDIGLKTAAQGTFDVLTNHILWLRGEPQDGVAALAETNPALCDVLDDILVGWTFIHGFAHLHTEQQLNMVTSSQMDESLDRVASRLSRLLTGNHGTMS